MPLCWQHGQTIFRFQQHGHAAENISVAILAQTHSVNRGKPNLFEGTQFPSEAEYVAHRVSQLDLRP